MILLKQKVRLVSNDLTVINYDTSCPYKPGINSNSSNF